MNFSSRKYYTRSRKLRFDRKFIIGALLIAFFISFLPVVLDYLYDKNLAATISRQEEDYQQEIVRTEEELKNGQKFLEEKKNELEELEFEFKSLSDQADSKTQEILAIEDEILILKNDIASQEAEIDRLNSEIAEYK